MGRRVRMLAVLLAFALVVVVVPAAREVAAAGPGRGTAAARAAVSPRAAVPTGTAAVVAAADSPPIVTRVDSSVHVTPDSTGRVTIPYCPASDPCAFASPPAGVVVTGKAPTGGVPQLPVNL